MVHFLRLIGKFRLSYSLVTKVCKRTIFEVLDCEFKGTLGMLFLKKFNPEIDWTTGATTIDRYTIFLVEN